VVGERECDGPDRGKALMADEAHDEIHVDADPARCFEVASNFEHYPSWAKDVKDAKVLVRDRAGRATRVEYRAAAFGRTVRYVLDYDLDAAPEVLSWTLVDGDMLRALDGRYAFMPEGRGTRVGYDLRVELSVPLPALVKRRASGLIVGAALRELKLTVEATTTDALLPTVESRSSVTSHPEPHPASHPPNSHPSERPSPEATSPHPDAVDFEVAGTEERILPAPSVLECAIAELLGAVPEVRDHVLVAADALLDAAKALIDAADRVVRQARNDDSR
jgi:hypothetical protein